MTPRITLITSNGWGLGHLSRQLAIALALEGRAEVTMFSFSRGLPLTSQFGVRGEFCPGHTSVWVPRERWNAYVEARFQSFITEVAPDVVLFDGVAPYLGIINALLVHPTISAGWLRRGMWLRGSNEVQLTKESAFDFVIEPGDIAAAADRGPTSSLPSLRVRPVSLLEVVPVLERQEAARGLGLDPDRPALLFALGSGQPGDSLDARSVALERALDDPSWQVGLVNSPLSSRQQGSDERAIQLHNVYPLMRYLSAFDAAVSAAGYNSVHELVPGGVPTLLVPKSSSQTDDQIARARYLAEQKLALTASDADLETVRLGVDELLRNRDDLRATLSGTSRETMLGGAHEVAGILASTPPTGVRATGREEWRQPGFKGWLKRAIGPSGVELVRRGLGRAPLRPPRRPVSLEPSRGDAAAHLLITADVEAVQASESQPVEHLLPGASGAYERSRRELVDEFYDVVD